MKIRGLCKVRPCNHVLAAAGLRLLRLLLLLQVLVGAVCKHASNDEERVEANAESSTGGVGSGGNGAGGGGLGRRVTGL